MHRKQGLPQTRFAERLGHATQPRPDGLLIWIHAASLGEVAQTAQLVGQLKQEHNCQILVTTMTQSGAAWVAKSLPDTLHQFVPVDTPAAVTGFLDHWAPDMAIFIEADIWPRLVMESSARNVPLALLNARPSKSRARAPKFYRYLLSHFFAITCKSKKVLDGLSALGLPSDRLHYFGDLRASLPPLPVDPALLDDLHSTVTTRPVWVAASSHAEDEAHILQAHNVVLTAHPDALLIWAPRHPDRAVQISEAACDFALHQRSQLEMVTVATEIFLADTLGELGTFFSCSKIVFLGGSFGEQGGHNPYEPACFGCYSLTGPNFKNHQEAFTEFMRVGAAEPVTDGIALGARISQMISTDSATQAGEKGRGLVQAANISAVSISALLADELHDQSGIVQV